MTPSTGPFAPGDQVGHARIEALVGRGGSATVYRAHDDRFAATVAVKVLSEHHAGDPEAVERFVQEARALRSVDSDSVVSVFDIAQTDSGLPYMVLRYADRGTLADRLELGRPGTDGDLRRLIDFFARAIGTLHGQRLVHRDVKPANVLLTSGPLDPAAQLGLLWEDDHLLLGDLGIVKDVSDQRVTRGAGSTAYAAPEQLAVISRVDERADIYAASAVVAEAALGRSRGDQESWAAVLAAVSAQGRPELAGALSRGLADDPEHRYPSIREWSNELAGTVVPHEPTRSGPSPMMTVVAFAALIGVLLAIPTLVRSLRNTDQPTVSQAEVAGIQVTSDEAETSTSPPPEPSTSAAPTPNSSEPTTVPVPTSIGAAGGAASERPPCVDRSDPSGELSGLAATYVSDRAVGITWDPVGGVMDISINGRYADTTRLHPETSLRVIEDLEPDTPHLVVLESGDASQAICITTLDAPVEPPDGIGPFRPTGFRVVARTSTSISVEWDLKSDAEWHNLFVDGVYQKDPASSVKGDQASWTFSGLEPDTEYQLGIRRVDGPNNSSLTELTARTLAPGEEDTTEGATESPGTTSGEAVENAAIGPSADGARGTQSAAGGIDDATSIQSLPDDLGSLEILRWDPEDWSPAGQVVAVSPGVASPAGGADFGVGPSNQPIGSVELSGSGSGLSACIDSASGPAVGLATLAITADAALITWQPVDQPLNLFVDGAYRDTLRPNSSTFAVEGLTSAMAHELIVTTADDLVGGSRLCVLTESDPSSSLPPEAVTAPVGVAALAMTDRAARITWTGTTAAASHLVFVSEPGATGPHPSVTWAGRADPGASEFQLDGLEPASRYLVGVRAFVDPNRSGIVFVEVTTASEASETVPVPTPSPSSPTPSPGPTPPAEPPLGCTDTLAGQVTSAYIESAHETAVAVTWDPVDMGLNIFATPLGATGHRYIDTAAPGADRFVIEGLAPATEYVIEVATFDEGPGERSLLCTTTLPAGDGQPPVGAVMVTDFNIDVVTESTITVSWSPVAGATGYRLIVGEPRDGTLPAIVGIKNVPASETTYSFFDLEPDADGAVAVGINTVVDNNRSGLRFVIVELLTNSTELVGS